MWGVGMPWLLAAVASTGMACAVGEPEDLGELEPEDRVAEELDDGKYEAWNRKNNPASVDSTFLYRAHQLPLVGASAPPIPGDYWATASDNLNHKWDDASSLSPAAKFAKAFGKPDLEEEISQNYGVKSATRQKKCETDSDCKGDGDAAICAKSYDGKEKRCIPTWWGICHGWAPYAFSEPAPTRQVVHTAQDGSKITFFPGDLEGLMSLVYGELPDGATKFLSERCDEDKVETDAYGRPTRGDCGDMNAGSWHVLVTNMLGLRKKSFVIDRTYDSQVWNQPVWKYRITNAKNGKLNEISREEAISQVGLAEERTTLVATSDMKKDEQKSGTYTAPAGGTITVRLQGSGDADLYVKKGSKATTDDSDCAPYLEGSTEECKVSVAAGDVIHWLIVGYAEKSRVQLSAGSALKDTSYRFNAAAQKFYLVEMAFTYIVESSPARRSHIDGVSDYAKTAHYRYVLEADADEQILGGEWIGESLGQHPDFAWWNTKKPTTTSVASGLISYAEVKLLHDQSAGVTSPGTGPVQVTVMENQTLATSGNWVSKYGTVEVQPGSTRLEITMSGEGDADLYVRARRNPTVTTFDCRSVTLGTSVERCTVKVPSTAGTYYVRARTRTPGTKVTVTATIQ